MSNFCSNLGQIDNIVVNCSLEKGYESTGYIVSRSDVDFSSIVYGYDNEDPQDPVVYPDTVITQMALKSGKKGSYIEQLKNPFSGTSVALAVGDYRSTFTNTLSFNIFGNSPEVAKIVNGLANDEFIVILEQKAKGENGESAFRIFGLSNGLTASEVSNDAYDDALGNGWRITMTEEAVSSAAQYLFVGSGSSEPSLSATEAALTSMFNRPE